MFQSTSAPEPREPRMIQLVVFTFGLLAGVQAGSYSYEYQHFPHLQMSVGTPDQGPFTFVLVVSATKYSSHNPTVTETASGGFFNPNASQTFKLRRAGKYDYVGTDTIKFPNGPTLRNQDIDVVKHDGNHGAVTIVHGDKDAPSFMDEVLTALGGDKTVILALKSSKFLSHNGTLILGDATPAACKNDWSVYPAHARAYMLMTIDSTEFEVGKYHQSEVVPLTFESEFIWFGPKAYAATAKQLGVQKNRQIGCNSKTPIRIKTVHHELVIEPRDYIQQTDGNCRFMILESLDNVFQIPLRFLNRQCLRFDFDMNTISMAPIA